MSIRRYGFFNMDMDKDEDGREGEPFPMRTALQLSTNALACLKQGFVLV